MDTNWIVVIAFLLGIAVLVWLLMYSVRKEHERPRCWWKKKKIEKIIPTKATPSECPWGDVPPMHPPSSGGVGGFGAF
jgi:hypothetical protein